MGYARREDILAREALGYTHFRWRGESCFVDMKSIDSINGFINYMYKRTMIKYSTYRERRGNQNLVIYNTMQYHPMGAGLHLYNDVSAIELPMGCSSCYRMFEGHRFTGNTTFVDNFDLSKVVDMQEAFADTVFTTNFMFGRNFDIPLACEEDKTIFKGTTFDAVYAFTYCNRSSAHRAIKLLEYERAEQKKQKEYREARRAMVFT